MIEREISEEYNKLTDIVFGDETEYIGFLRQVFQERGGIGLNFTRYPITMCLQVETELWSSLKDDFPSARPVNKDDVTNALAPIKRRKLFDPESIRGRHVPRTGINIIAEIMRR